MGANSRKTADAIPLDTPNNDNGYEYNWFTKISRHKNNPVYDTKCLSRLRIDRITIGQYAAVACPLGNSQLLELQSGLYSAICNRLTTHSKPEEPMVHLILLKMQ